MILIQAQSRIFRIVALVVLGGLGFLLTFISFSLLGPLFPKLDFSNVPGLIGAIIFGPIGVVIIEAIKQLLGLLFIGTDAPLGVIEDFVGGLLFVLPLAFMVRKGRNKKRLVFGLLIGIGLSSIVMALLSFLIMIPLSLSFQDLPSLPAILRLKISVSFLLPLYLIQSVMNVLVFLLLYPLLKLLMERWNLLKGAE